MKRRGKWRRLNLSKEMTKIAGSDTYTARMVMAKNEEVGVTKRSYLSVINEYFELNKTLCNSYTFASFI